MKIFKRKSKKQSALWIYALIGLIAYFSFLGIKGFQDLDAQTKEELEWQQKIENEQAKSEQLDRIAEKASSQKTIESIARGNLNYLKDGEILFVDSAHQ